MLRSTRSRLVDQDGRVFRHDGEPFSGALFDSDGTDVEATVVVEGESVGPYRSPFIDNIAQYRALDLGGVVNDKTGDQPTPFDARFHFEGLPFTGVGYDLESLDGETLWIDGYPAQSIGYEFGDFSYYERFGSPISEEYHFGSTGDDGPTLRMARIELSGRSDCRFLLEIASDATVSRLVIGEGFPMLLRPLRDLLLMPELVDDSFLDSLPGVGQPLSIPTHHCRSLLR